uniref:TPX2 C-terminal domain-containing protein n=1 Tax=Glossina morsitans morsitans TaxID=37546 RepID=A0A1B0FAH3_GLOMM
MENNNVNCEKSFDWDDIDVGNHYLDHSENFFGSKHKLCSRQDVFKLHLEESEKEKKRLNDPSHKEQDAKTPISGNEENVEIKKESAVNLVPMWTDKKKIVTAPSKGAIPKSTPRTPKAYKVIDYYKRKKEEAERLRAEEERNKRVFHSKPMPNFNYYHEKLEKRMVIHTITVPVTPEVLKHSRSMKQKSEKKVFMIAYFLKTSFEKEMNAFQPAELKQKEQVPKFESRLRAEEERNKRVFHSKPMPNFNYYHEKLEKQMVAHAVTVPVTSKVFKHSRSMKQKSEKKVFMIAYFSKTSSEKEMHAFQPAELKQKEQVPKFESRPPSVLEVKPSIPERKHTTNEQRPFNLPMQWRLKKRNQYNEALKQNIKEAQSQYFLLQH